VATIFIDNDDHSTWTSRDPNFVPPTISELLAEEFDQAADFYVCDGQMYLVFPDWDYAEEWSAYPIREVHPLYPVLNGKKITEAEFRTLVREIHHLS
jgi:hypothetical protein